MQNLEALSILQPLRNESDPEKQFRLEDCRAKIVRKGPKVGVFLNKDAIGDWVFIEIYMENQKKSTNISES